MTVNLRQVTVEQEPFTIGDGLQYRVDSGDRNPIHCGTQWFRDHPAYVNSVGIKSPIVPGMLYAGAGVEHAKALLERLSRFQWDLTSFRAHFQKPLYYGTPCQYELSVEKLDELNERATVHSTLHAREQLFSLDIEFATASDTPEETMNPLSLLASIPRRVVEKLGDGVLLARVNADFPGKIFWRDFLKESPEVSWLRSKRIHQSPKGALFEIHFVVSIRQSHVATCDVVAFQPSK